MAVVPRAPLPTPTGHGQFSVAPTTNDGLALLPHDKEAWTPLPWRALEEVPGLLGGFSSEPGSGQTGL